MSDIYLSLTETPTVVTLSQPVVSGVLSSNVTVTNVVSVNVVTMPAITVQAAAPAVTTVAGTVSISNFPSTQTIAGTVTANVGPEIVGDKGGGIVPNNAVAIGHEVVGDGFYNVSTDRPLPISGTVTVGNSVTIGSLPAISGTVTAQFPANSKRSLYVNSPGYAYFTGIYVAENQKLEVNRVSYKSTNSDASIDYRTDDNRWYLTTGGGTGVYKSTTTGSFEPIGLSWQQGEGANFPPYPTVTTFSEICVADAKISSLPAIRGTVTVGNSVTIGSIPGELVRSAVTYGRMNISANSSAVTVNSSAFDSGTQGDHVYLRYVFWATGTPGVNTIQSSADNSTWANVTTAFNTDSNKIETISLPTGNYSVVSYIWPKSSSQRYWRIQTSPQPNGAQDSSAEFAVYNFKPDYKFIGVGQSVASGANTYYHGIYAQQVAVATMPAISGTVAARLQDGSGNNLTSTSIGGLQRLNVSLASAATPGGALPSFVNVYGGSDGSAVRTISVDSSGRQNINAQFPRVTFIDGSGTVTTANTAITVFASSSTRSYLLVQVTTGSAFVNVGATATTVNGINLTAGQGYSWETTIPQGIVSLISTTTSSRYVAKEA